MPTGSMPTTPGPRRSRPEQRAALLIPAPQGGGRRTRVLSAIQRREPFGLCDIVKRIGIEEWIERLGRPCYGSKRVARRPAFDLADIFDHQRVTKLLAQRNTP